MQTKLQVLLRFPFDDGGAVRDDYQDQVAEMKLRVLLRLLPVA